MPHPYRARAQDGFTLAELLIALLVLALLASGVASLLSLAARMLVRSRVETTAVLLAHGRLEQLQSLGWGFGSVWMPAPGIDLVTDLSGPDPAVGGNGLGGAPPGALDADSAGFVDYHDQAGRWLGRGTTPPDGTRFVRRWSVESVAGFPDMRLLRVRVLDRRAEISDVVLATVKTRTAG
jgi:prepilin-type N-terminal cleavage/methylation domain-containing protein